MVSRGWFNTWSLGGLRDLELPDVCIRVDHDHVVFEIGNADGDVEVTVSIVVKQTHIVITIYTHDRWLDLCEYPDRHVPPCGPMSTVARGDFAAVEFAVTREPLFIDEACRLSVWSTLLSFRPALTSINKALVNLNGL